MGNKAYKTVATEDSDIPPVHYKNTNDTKLMVSARQAFRTDLNYDDFDDESDLDERVGQRKKLLLSTTYIYQYHGISVCKNANGDTALTIASAHNNRLMVEELIRRGADLNVQNKYGNSALMEAVAKNHRLVAGQLIEAGVDLDAQNQDWKTALIVASEQGQLETVRELLFQGADPNIQNKYGRTALMNAAGQLNHLEIGA